MITQTYLTVRYAETDMMGIVHHSRYYPWFEVARTEFIKESGISYSEMEKMAVLHPLTQTGCNYIHGLRYEEEVMIKCSLAELSVARCRFNYEVYKLPEMKLMSTGHTCHGFVGKEFKPLNLKKSFPELWEKLSKLVEEGDKQ